MNPIDQLIHRVWVAINQVPWVLFLLLGFVTTVVLVWTVGTHKPAAFADSGISSYYDDQWGVVCYRWSGELSCVRACEGEQ